MSWITEEPVRGEYPPIEMLGMTGLERVTARSRGLVYMPPVHHLTGLRPVDEGSGVSVFELPAHAWLRTSVGLFPAGVCALVADAPLGAAILTQIGAGAFGVTSELSMSFLRPASVDSHRLLARAKAIEVGRSLGLSECVVEDAHGRMLAHGTSRYFIRHLPNIPAPPSLEPVSARVYPTPDPYLRPAPDLEPAERWMGLSGLEHVRAVADGALAPPPIELLFGFHAVEVAEGSVKFTAPASPWLTSPARTVYGGILALYADAAMTAATATTLPAGQSCATLDLKVHFLRPGLGDGTTLTVAASVVHRGRSLAVTRAEVANAEGKPLVIATGSGLVIDRPWQAVAVADEPEGLADESDSG